MRLVGSSRFGGFNLGTRLSREAFERSIMPVASDLQTFCLLVHRRVEELTMGHAPGGAFRSRLVAPAPEPGEGGTRETRIASLSEREREVLYLAARGLTRGAIGALCSVSESTVATHLRSIYAKLDVPNRAAATRIAVEAGLTGPPTAPHHLVRSDDTDTPGATRIS